MFVVQPFDKYQSRDVHPVLFQALEAAEPPRAYHDGSWEIDETEVNP